MNLNFVYHLLISGCIFYLLTAGAKMYVKLRGSLDFSYLGIVIFGAYASVLIHLHWGFALLPAMIIAFICSLGFTLIVLFLSGKLEGLYFTIGTLTLYILFYQSAFNLESITGGAFGLSGMTRNIIGTFDASALPAFFGFVISIVLCTIAFLLYFKRTYIYKVLQGRGEREVVLQSLGVRVSHYKFIMICITTALAVIGGGLYSFYYLFIDPHSFWLPMLVLLLVLVFGSYKFNEIGTFIFSLIIVGIYEGLRFFKVVDPSQIGYFREIIFASIILVTSFWIFRTTQFGRET